ncbi:MAG TPA: elongation factor G [Clostridiaceae bacterium]|nr:elongation factor G [Clostridiaceae bacterium]
MKAYTTDKIRNICLMSHGGAGKTTLAEAMLYNCGAIERMGKVTDGNTVSDYDPEEIKRSISISTSIMPCEWKGYKINVIDTPGYFDFVGEVMQGIRVADGAVILVHAKGGVQVGTEKAWAYANQYGMPRMFYINKMDEEHADFDATYNQLKEMFGVGVVAFQLPIMENGKFTGVVDVLNMKAKKFDSRGNAIDAEIPASLFDKVQEIKDSLNEAIAENDEELMEKFFGGEEFTPEEISRGLKIGLSDGSLVPVFCGAAFNNQGVQTLLDGIIDFMPAPDAKGSVKAKKAGSGEDIEVKVAESEPLSALVFKTIADPFVGKISLFKVYSGALKADSTVYNTDKEKTEKIAQIFYLQGKEKISAAKIVAGDIAAVAKLQLTGTNDTLCDQANPVVLEKISFPEPAISLAVEPKAKGDEEKISSGLQKLQDEDPTFKVEVNAETKQILISGVGEQHLDVVVSKLKAKFNVSVDLKDPKVPYRETIRRKVKVEGKHKKQSGGHGQYGHVFIEFEPGEQEDLTFEEKIFGGAVPRQYFPAVEKGLRESIQKGVLAGYPVVNLKATLVDGSFHPVDSSEMAFKIAASLAYKKGMEEANPVLLEPIAHVEVYVPDSYMGDIIGDLNKRRGRILGMNPQGGGIQQVVAEVPQAEMFKYATDLRSMTQGRGHFKLWFERYEEAPPNVAQKVIETAKKEKEDEAE